MNPALPALVLLMGFAACGGDEGPSPVFRADYEPLYTEVRDCRPSGDHNLNNIRIVVDELALGPYQNRDQNFPVGAVVLKEEYEFDDTDCSGAIKQWTAMKRLADGEDPANLDWYWQKVDDSGTVVEENTPSCAGCHTGCGAPPDGFDGTCAVP